LVPDDLLAGIEGVVRQVARRILGDQALKASRLARRIVETSRRYTVDRRLPSADLDPGARLAFFTLADLPKLSYPLAEIGPLEGREELRILDVGAGHGAQTLGLLAALEHDCSLRIEAVDRDPRGLEILEQVVDGCRESLAIGRRSTLVKRVVDLETSAPGGSHDLVLVGSVLNELTEGRRIQLVLDLIASLAPGGRLIILEPALRKTARELQKLRDRILELGAADLLAPCTHTGTPCPMLAPGKDGPLAARRPFAPDSDWCHERRPWTPPPGVRALSRATGLRRGDLKWSYLSLAGKGEGRPVGGESIWRTVSDPLPSKGKLELFLCGCAGRVRAVRLNRHRSQSNRPFQRLRRGWLARIEGAALEGTTLRVGADTEVAAEDPSARS
jgi:ribosomal protein RSM22 (predicted rRNA methylase)